MDSIFIFCLDGDPDPVNGIYVTWADLMDAINAAPAGPKMIAFDNEVVWPAPLIIPTGTYSMQDITWVRRDATSLGPCLIRIDEGTVFTQFRKIVGVLKIEFTGTTPPVSDFVSGDVMSIDGGATLQCTGTGPFFRNTDTDSANSGPVVFALGSAKWLTGSNAIFDSSVEGAFTLIGASAFNSTLNSATLEGVDGSSIALISQIYGVGISSIGLGKASEEHPSFDGMLLPVNNPHWRLRLSAIFSSAGALTLSAANQLIRVDPTEIPLTIELPSVKGNHGLSILVKNVSSSTNLITIVPQAGETVDGDVSGATITTARGSLMLVADGTSDWMVTARIGT